MDSSKYADYLKRKQLFSLSLLLTGIYVCFGRSEWIETLSKKEIENTVSSFTKNLLNRYVNNDSSSSEWISAGSDAQ